MESSGGQSRFRSAVREPLGHFPLLGCTVRIAVLALALVVGWAGPSRADDPGPASDVPVPEQAPEQAPDPAPAEGHVHDVGQPPDRSARDWLKDVWTRDKLTGDWRGLRTDLHDHGIDISLRLSQYGQGVASGGVDKNGEYGGTMDYRVHADLAKAVGLWEGLSIDLHARTRFGEDIGADAGGLVLPNTGLLMPLPGDYSDSDITGLLVNQLFPLWAGHEGLFSLGKIDVLDAVTLFFPYVTYGQEGFWNVNALVSALPWFGAVRGLSLYGSWLASINEEFQIGESAILVTGTENVTTSWEFSDSFKHGVWIAAFHRFLYKIDDKPGYFMVFGGVSTRDQVSVESLDFIFIPGAGLSIDADEKKPWNIALYLSQVFWQAEDDPNRKATILIGGTLGPDEPQFAQWNLFASVEAYGPMAVRPGDRMGVSFWYNWLAEPFVDTLSDLPVDPIRLRDTWGFELYYNVAINKWLHLTADLQLVQNENKGDDFAVIPGVRLVIDF
jgi:porin